MGELHSRGMDETVTTGYQLDISQIALIIPAILATVASFITNSTLIGKTCASDRSYELQMNVTRYLLILAGTDMLAAVVNAFIVFDVVFLESQWPLGKFMCYLKEPLTHSIIGCSCALMMMIAMERFRYLVSESVSRFNNRRRSTISGSYHGLLNESAGKMLPALIMVVAYTLFSLPAILNAKLLPVEGFPFDNFNFTEEGFALDNFNFSMGNISYGYFCIQDWQNYELFIGYRISFLFFTCVLPLIFTFTLHLRIIRFLSNKIGQRQPLIMRRTSIILIGVVVLFAICWIPHQVLSLIIDLQTTRDVDDSSIFHFFPVIICAFKILIIIQTAINPILYSVHLRQPSLRQQSFPPLPQNGELLK